MEHIVVRSYVPSERVASQIERGFTYHEPQADQTPRFEEIRRAAREFALIVAQNSPESREQSLALTDIDNAVMHANAAIARNE